MENEGNTSHWPFNSQLAHQPMLLTSHQHIPLYEAGYPLPTVGVSRKKLWAKKGEKTVGLDPLSFRKPGVSLAPCGTRFCFAGGVELCSVDLTLSPIPFLIDHLSSLSFVGDLSQSSRGRQNLSKLGTVNYKSRKKGQETSGELFETGFTTFSLLLVNCKFSVDVVWWKC